MKRPGSSRFLVQTVLATAVAAVLSPLGAEAASFGQVNIAVPSPLEAVGWYSRHLDCSAVAQRENVVDCGGVEIEFLVRPVLGGSQGTGIDHIAFSYADVPAKMAELERVGVSGNGVRLERNADGSTWRAIPGLYNAGYIFDPWGTSIEILEDPDQLGFHHIHLSARDPDATLDWYAAAFGGEASRFKNRLRGLRFDDLWLLFDEHEGVAPASTDGRSLDHLTFVAPDLDVALASLNEAGIRPEQPAAIPDNGRSASRQALLMGPDGVHLALVERGWEGLAMAPAAAADELVADESYTPPLTPWGEPDLQGIWSGDAASGIPLERPEDIPASEVLTAVEAAARRERGTLRSIWGYEREWRDTTLEYAKNAPLTQVAMVVDPPDGRLPPMTSAATAARAAAREAARAASEEGGDLRDLPAGPEDLSNYVRCITRGLPSLMMPSIYNNGLQIVQSPGTVAITKEMIHETRVVPIVANPGQRDETAEITQWLGNSRGWWEGDTLVVEVTGFDGRTSFQGSSPEMTLTERYTRVAPNVLQYEFTVDDPTVWTRPWTAVFPFMRDDSQYELVEYACHEGNYAMENILSGARASERAAQDGADE